VAEWRGLQDSVAAGQVPEEQLLAMVIETIASFNELVDARVQRIGLGPALAFAFGIGIMFALLPVIGNSPLVGFVALIVCTLPTIYVAMTDVRRFAKRKVVPALADALLSLNPSLELLTTALAQVRSDGLRIGKAVKPRTLADAIDQRMEQALGRVR
jgi:Flp pilus assembly protein TadB